MGKIISSLKCIMMKTEESKKLMSTKKILTSTTIQKLLLFLSKLSLSS